MRLCVFLLLALATQACAKYVPPEAPAPRAASPVAASFDRTWDAVIDVFASRVITIETMERASGFIVASSAGIPGRSKADTTAALALADCGYTNEPGGRWLPQRAKYNVVVRTVGVGSSVQVTTKFLSSRGSETVECSSKGAFESNFEQAVKAKAESSNR